MASPLLKSWTPTTTYEFDLRIGNKEYSNDMVALKIKSGADLPYQNFSIDLFVDSTDLIKEKIYGQTPIKLSIKLKAQTHDTKEQVDFDLLFLNVSTDFAMQRVESTQDQEERTALRIECISRPSFQTMTTMVNDVFYNKKPEDIIRSILGNTQAEIEYDTNGKSTLAIDQLLIPPSTVYKTINYLDKTYGIFNGVLGLHCTHDNIVKIQNLSKKTTSKQSLTIYQLATHMDQAKILELTDPSKFYTKVPIKVYNRSNSIFSGISPTNRFIVKPKDQLSATLDINTEELIKSYGIIPPVVSGEPVVYYDRFAISPTNRIGYHTNNTGYDLDKTFINSNLSREVSDAVLLVVELKHSLPLLNLMAVGDAVDFLPQVTDYNALAGMYVLKSSELGWVRSRMWESWARLYMSRSIIAKV